MLRGWTGSAFSDLATKLVQRHDTCSTSFPSIYCTGQSFGFLFSPEELPIGHVWKNDWKQSAKPFQWGRRGMAELVHPYEVQGQSRKRPVKGESEYWTFYRTVLNFFCVESHVSRSPRWTISEFASSLETRHVMNFVESRFEPQPHENQECRP